MEIHAFPHIGDKRVDKIAYSDLAFVRPLCITNPPTAHFLIMSMKKIFDRCLFDKHIASNPVDAAFMAQLDWGDHRTQHFPALPYHLVPEAMTAIDKPGKTDISTRSCLKCIILNEVRPHTAENAEWSEILWKDIRDEHDWDDPNGWQPVDWSALDGSTKSIVWRIPDDHMKQKDAFVIPVSKQFLEVLKEMRAVRGQGERDPSLIFASPRGGKLSRTPIKKLLRRLGFPSDTEGRNTNPARFPLNGSCMGEEAQVSPGTSPRRRCRTTRALRSNSPICAGICWSRERASISFMRTMLLAIWRLAGCGSSRRFKRSLTRSAFGLMRLSAVRMRRRGGQKRRSAGWSGWKVSLPR